MENQFHYTQLFPQVHPIIPYTVHRYMSLTKLYTVHGYTTPYTVHRYMSLTTLYTVHGYTAHHTLYGTQIHEFTKLYTVHGYTAHHTLYGTQVHEFNHTKLNFTWYIGIHKVHYTLRTVPVYNILTEQAVQYTYRDYIRQTGTVH